VTEPDTLSLPQAAERLGISVRQARNLAKTGQLCEGLPVIRFGERYRVSVHQLEQVLGLKAS
jgi:hypothetical protein